VPVEVSVGALLPFHRTDAGQVCVYCPPLIKNSENAPVRLPVGGCENTHVVVAVDVAENVLPFCRLAVAVPPAFPRLESVSE
jgi:hypothetical protein